ncbi:MAG: BMP family ABC transporter substrate-binding protein, partial [Lachnospiraceae bacterium]|nr:BMP family ABC transporter substrate-binding protein [Lachnospiraceae bacterium]
LKQVMTALILTVCLAMTCLLAGCGQAEEETTTAAPETTEATTEETTEETTPAPTEPPTRQVSELKVGMIFYGEENDGSLLASTLRQEMTEAAVAIGMTDDQILVRYNSREADWTQIEESILNCVDSGCQLILGCAREYEAVIAAIAEEYPQVMFACVGSQLYNGINSGTFTIDVGAAQYLCGALAGLQTATDRVGFVAAKDSGDMTVTQAVNAFAYGVWSTNQEAVVDVAVIGKWFLPGAESQGIDYLDSLGCDVIESYTDRWIGSLQYQWQQYFSMKLNQIIQKEVIGESWSGDYYGGAVTCDLAVELPEYVWGQLAQWGTLTEEIPEETVPEATEGMLEETVPETVEVIPEDSLSETMEQTTEVSMEETATEPYVVPEIEIDGDTGYLTNVRVHEIEWEE